MSTDMQKINWPGWETVGLIGRGSFGAVYKIQRNGFGEAEECALKVISVPPREEDIEEMHGSGLDDESIIETIREHVRSIDEEYSLMRKLCDCVNIINCDDIRHVPHDDGVGVDIFIKMELLMPLTKALPAKIPEEMVMKIAKDMCNALVACKEYDIIHRDIKPQNIFVSKRGDYKLGDFGIAKIVEKTMGGTTIGTYDYMAPEVRNYQPYGVSADIYALGLVLYWLLNERRLPFLPLPPEKFTPDMNEQARNRRFSGEPVPPPAHGSEELKAIVLKACAFDPKERFSSAAEMLAALKVLSGKPVVATPPELKPETKPEPKPESKPEPKPAPKPEPVPTSVKEDDGLGLGCGLIFFIMGLVVGLALLLARETHDGICAILLGIAAAVVVFIISAIRRRMLNRKVQKQSNEIAKPDGKYGLIDCRNYHLVMCRKNCTVFSRGDNTFGQCDVLGWTGIDMIAAGSSHTVGLRLDGTVVSVGNNSYSQCDVSGWTDIKMIATGSEYTVGLKEDGTVVAVGSNDVGQCNVSRWTGVEMIATGAFHTVGLKRNGTLVATGFNRYGQCDVSSWTGIGVIAASEYHTVGLKQNGTVVAVGLNSYGECDVVDWVGITMIAAGAFHTVGLKKDGTVIAAGANASGQCDVSSWTNIIAVYAGPSCTVGLKADGSCVVVGEGAGKWAIDITR